MGEKEHDDFWMKSNLSFLSPDFERSAARQKIVGIGNHAGDRSSDDIAMEIPPRRKMSEIDPRRNTKN